MEFAMTQDTEALKALVALAQKLPKLPFAERDGVQNADFAMAAVKALPALERMLASQTQDLYAIAETALREYRCQYRVYDHELDNGMALYDVLGKDELDLLIDAVGGALQDASAAPVASQMGEPDMEALAKEFAEAIDFTAGPPEARDVFRELLRKHQRKQPIEEEAHAAFLSAFSAGYGTATGGHKNDSAESQWEHYKAAHFRPNAEAAPAAGMDADSAAMEIWRATEGLSPEAIAAIIRKHMK